MRKIQRCLLSTDSRITAAALVALVFGIGIVWSYLSISALQDTHVPFRNVTLKFKSDPPSISDAHRFRLELPASMTDAHRAFVRQHHGHVLGADGDPLGELSVTSNMAPHALRCRFTQKWRQSQTANEEMYELWMNEFFGFLHIFKSGGSTIQQMLSKMTEMLIIPDPQDAYRRYFYRKLGVDDAPPTAHYVNVPPGQFHRLFGFDVWHARSRIAPQPQNTTAAYLEHWKQQRLSDVFLFSFVRDPPRR